MNTLTFQNKEYQVREIVLPEFGNVLISTVSLNEDLLCNGSDYVSKEAQLIDEEICFFVEENEIELDNEDLIKVIG